MKRTAVSRVVNGKFCFLVVLFAVFVTAAGHVWADGLRQPTSLRDAALGKGTYLYWMPQEQPSPSPSDRSPSAPKPGETSPDADGTEALSGNGCGSSLCGNGGRMDRWCCCGTLADPWRLPMPPALQCRGITVGGWLSGGIYANAHGDESNGPIGLRNVGDGFTADQLWIFAEKKAANNGSGVAWGFRVDYLFGADAPDTQAFGDQDWDFSWRTARDYGSAMPQLYVELAFNDLSIRGGRFFSPIGYEVVPVGGNFFYSHSYSHTFGEPFTHTGVLGSYKVNEKLTAHAGWVDGWDNGWRNFTGASMFLGGLSVQPSDKSTLAWYCTVGRFGNGALGGNHGELYMNSIVFTRKLGEKWTYVLEHVLGTNYGLGVANGLGAADNQWYSIVQYLFYKHNDCLSSGLRLEWFRDEDGARVLTDGPWTNARLIANPGDYWELSYGVNYKPHANLTIRPELRYDWFNGTIRPGHNRPFNKGNAIDQFSGGFDVIFTF